MDILEEMRDRLINDPQVLFFAGQFEQAPETGRLHLQGYVCLDRSVRMRGAQAVIGAGSLVHVERRRGSHDDAVAYVTKNESRYDAENQVPVVVDRRRPEGAAGVWTAIHQMVMEGRTDVEICAEYPAQFARHTNGIAAMRQAIMPERTTKPLVIWLCGPTGCGKSRLCAALSHGRTCLWKSPDQWWAQYTQQQVVILDELTPDWMPFRTLLRILDRYPLIGQIKGGHVLINSPVFLITCPGHIMATYQVNMAECAELERRLDFYLMFERHAVASGVRYYLTSRKEWNYGDRVTRSALRQAVEEAIVDWSMPTRFLGEPVEYWEE